MNQVTREQKDRVMKTLAIFGFLAVIIFGVWLAVQIVSLMPQAFSSLASIADGVYNYREATELIVETEKSAVNTGETFTVSWETITEPGVYAFSYVCAEGVALELSDDSGKTVLVTCNENVFLGSDISAIDVTVSSERQHFSDVSYAVSFIPEDAGKDPQVSENMVSVINANIPEPNTETNTVDDTQPVVDVEVEEPVEVVDETESTPTPTAPTAPAVVETVVYETPTSNPNGYTDLAVELVAVGQLDQSGNFEKRANIDEGARGAFQFVVKNIGTKTSTTWDFEAVLTSGVEYDAPEQMALKPQERVLFTLGYDNVGDDGISIIGVTIRGGGDTVASNNSFTWAVSVVE